MNKIINRLFDLSLPKGTSAFLWGPRQTGKSYWIRHNLKNAVVIDLLKSEEFADYSTRPQLLRERFSSEKCLVVIDEVQKVPALLDEVHWLIENSKVDFLLTGSSARKLKRGQANLLGGRAWKRHMVPLCYKEVSSYDLESVMASGLLPPHYLSAHPHEGHRSYVADYLKEEIAAEALVQNLPAFADFLRVAALTSSELLNYANVGREVGVPPRVVRHYFEIIEDTYLGYRVRPWTRSRHRRLIETEKFYFFDVGLANYLSKRKPKTGTSEFGKSFEHLILMELLAYQAYRSPEMEIRFWRTSTNQEVDFIVNDRELAIEIKGSSRVHEGDLRHLMSLAEDGPIRKMVVVCLESTRRKVVGKIEIYPWREFLEELWAGNLIS